MSKTIRKVLVLIVFVGVVAGLFVYKYLSTRTLFNDGSVNGNTPGNLYGEGLFCEHDGKVYFSNPMDGNALYVMNPNETEVKKLADDNCFYINADDNYLYYSRNHNRDNSQMAFLNVAVNALCRINHDGKNVKILDEDVSSYQALVGNTIYYMHYNKEEASTLYSVGIDGKNKTQVFNLSVDSRGAYDKYLYYSGVVDDHKLYRLDTQTMVETSLYNGNVWQPVYDGQYVYAIDLDNDYRLIRINLNDGSSDVMSDRKVFTFNLYDRYLFYQDMGDDAALRVINVNTGTDDLVAVGNYNSINVTSKFVYFKDYNTGAMYHSTYSDGNYMSGVFNPGVDNR